MIFGLSGSQQTTFSLLNVDFRHRNQATTCNTIGGPMIRPTRFGDGAKPSAVRLWSPPNNPRRLRFDDEVAIDFPSMASALEGIRASFFNDASSSSVLTVDLPLSQSEAQRGQRIALNLPLQSMCEPCGGRGETWGDPCAFCGGAGYTTTSQAVEIVVPSGVRDGTRLRFSVSSPLVIATIVEVNIELTHRC